MEKTALGLAELLRDHRGKDVMLLDMRELSFWTDFFIIATVSSRTHMEGLLRHIKEYSREQDLEILRGRHKAAPEEWNLIDMGSLVVHLMTEKARSFYELERLWGSARIQALPPLSDTTPESGASGTDYSPKSSS